MSAKEREGVKARTFEFAERRTGRKWACAETFNLQSRGVKSVRRNKVKL